MSRKLLSFQVWLVAPRCSHSPQSAFTFTTTRRLTTVTKFTKLTLQKVKSENIFSSQGRTYCCGSFAAKNLYSVSGIKKTYPSFTSYPQRLCAFVKTNDPYHHNNILCRLSSTVAAEEKSLGYLDAKDEEVHKILSEHMTVVKDFLSEDEEKSLLVEVDRYMKRLRYEFDHWDNAIHGYRETEKKSWNESNSQILQRVKDIAFHAGVGPLAYVHVLDIAKEGYIKPHVDAVRFCGDTIAGLCLLSSCVMRLALEKDGTKFGDIHLPQRCLYIMRGRARYDFTHEVLKEEDSIFKGQVIQRDRRISVICRNEPDPVDQE